MIQLFVKLGKWLEMRFPEKLVLKVEEYLNLKQDVFAIHSEITLARQELANALTQIDILAQRLAAVESAAVHKGAVQDLVSVVKGIKDELSSLKVNIGFGNPSLAKIETYLSGEPVNSEDTNG